MEKEKALEIWDSIFGAKKWATDCFGTWMYRDDYGETDKKRNNRPDGTGKYYSYGWEIDHIKPKSKFGEESDADLMNNFEPLHWENNRSKADGFPTFMIDNNRYKVVKCEICSMHNLEGYGIVNSEGKRIDWKGVTSRYYPKN